MNLRHQFQMGWAAPLRGLHFGRCGSAALPMAMILFFAVGTMAATTNDLSDAAIQGRRLAQQLCNTRPAESLTNTGVLKIRDAQRRWLEIPVRFQITAAVADSPGWEACYETTGTNNHWLLTISHFANQPNHYRLVKPDGAGRSDRQRNCHSVRRIGLLDCRFRPGVSFSGRNRKF